MAQISRTHLAHVTESEWWSNCRECIIDVGIDMPKLDASSGYKSVSYVHGGPIHDWRDEERAFSAFFA